MPGGRADIRQEPEQSGHFWRVDFTAEAEFPRSEIDMSAVLRRRQLLQHGFWAGMGVLAAGGLATVLEFLNPRAPHSFGGSVTVPPNKVPRPGESPYHDRAGRFWLVNLKPGEGVPKQVQHVAAPSRQGGLMALYERCPHPLLVAAILWRPDLRFTPNSFLSGPEGWFRCPACDSTFTEGGVRVFGPAPRSMDTFRITDISEHGVTVNTGAMLLGGFDDPQRTVPAGPFGG